MGNLRLRYRIPLAVIAILMVMTLFVGSSYALWKTTVYQKSENRIDTGCFEISFLDKSNSISLTNSYPMEDARGLRSTPYIFTIKNTCTVDARFTLYLNTFLPITEYVKIDDQFVKYALVRMEDGVELESPIPQSLTTDATMNPNFAEQFETASKISSSYEIGGGTIKGKSDITMDDGGEATFALRIWIDRDATKEDIPYGSTFEAEVVSIAYATTTTN